MRNKSSGLGKRYWLSEILKQIKCSGLGKRHWLSENLKQIKCSGLGMRHCYLKLATKIRQNVPQNYFIDMF